MHTPAFLLPPSLVRAKQLAVARLRGQTLPARGLLRLVKSELEVACHCVCTDELKHVDDPTKIRRELYNNRTAFRRVVNDILQELSEDS